MSNGYRQNGGVIGTQNSFSAIAAGVWGVKENFINRAPLPGEVAGEYQYTTVGSHTFTVPTGRYSITILVISGGGGGIHFVSPTTNYNYRMNGGGGGALAWKNNVSVVPGDAYTVIVGGGGSQGAYSAGSTAGGTSSVTGTGITMSCTGGGPGRYNATVDPGIASGGDTGGNQRSVQYAPQ